MNNPAGHKVGTVAHLRNRELLVVAGTPTSMRAAMTAIKEGGTASRPPAAARVPSQVDRT